jgi:hypothetical protein
LKTLRESILEDRLAEIQEEANHHAVIKEKLTSELNKVEKRINELEEEHLKLDIELKHHQYKRGEL